jgi:hypothetical protein
MLVVIAAAWARDHYCCVRASRGLENDLLKQGIQIVLLKHALAAHGEVMVETDDGVTVVPKVDEHDY